MKRSSNILIERLSNDATVSGIGPIVSQFGRVARLVVEHDPSPESSNAKCWITFSRHSDARRAIRNLNNRVIAGKRVSAKWADADRAQSRSIPRVDRQRGLRASREPVVGTDVA